MHLTFEVTTRVNIQPAAIRPVKLYPMLSLGGRRPFATFDAAVLGADGQQIEGEHELIGNPVLERSIGTAVAGRPERVATHFHAIFGGDKRFEFIATTSEPPDSGHPGCNRAKVPGQPFPSATDPTKCLFLSLTNLHRRATNGARAFPNG
jgi:hypothetical protein